MVLVTGPTGSGKTTTLYAALSEIKSVEDKIITIEDPVEYQLQGHHADSDQREEGADVRARAAVDPAPRPRQDHGRRDPRPRDGADRHPVGAHRPPGVHHRPRQQRARRARPLPQHGRRAVSVRLGAQLRAGAAAGARSSARTASGRRRCRARCSRSRRSIRRSSTTHTFYEGAGCIECGGTGFKGRMAICELLDLTDRIREMILEKRPTSEIKKAAREEGMRFLRESAVERVLDGRHDAARDQQGDVRRMSLCSSLRDAPPPDGRGRDRGATACRRRASSGAAASRWSRRTRSSRCRTARSSPSLTAPNILDRAAVVDGASAACSSRSAAAAARRPGRSGSGRQGVAGPLRAGAGARAGSRSAGPLAGPQERRRSRSRKRRSATCPGACTPTARSSSSRWRGATSSQEYEALCAAAGAHAGLVDLATFNVVNAVLAGSGAARRATGCSCNVARRLRVDRDPARRRT